MRHLDPVRHMLDVVDACRSHWPTPDAGLRAVRILAEGAGFICHRGPRDASFGLCLAHPDDVRIICVDGSGRTCVFRGGPTIAALRPAPSAARHAGTGGARLAGDRMDPI